jgi:hypothetical protein
MMVGASGQLRTEAALAVAAGGEGGMFVLGVEPLLCARDVGMKVRDKEITKTSGRNRSAAGMPVNTSPQAPVRGWLLPEIGRRGRVGMRKINHAPPTLPSIFL